MATERARLAMWYAYDDGRYVVMSRQGPVTDRAEQDCIASFDSKEEALAWAAGQERSVIWR